MTAVSLRARKVVSDAQLRDIEIGLGSLERVPTAMTNEVWFADRHVIRISKRPGTARLRHEALIARTLPPAVRYPPVVASGVTGPIEWLILDRVPGVVLSEAWPGLDDESRHRAVAELADAVKALHGTAHAGPAPPYLEGDTLECPHQLPPSRVLALLDRARQLPYVDRGVIDAASGLLRERSPALDDAPPRTLVHGDLHFENVLWDGTRVTALLDFEWARPGPPDLDLDILLRFLADPDQHVSGHYHRDANRADYAKVVEWLQAACPDLFAHPRLIDRLTVYALAYDVPQLLLNPPRRHPARLSPMHPFHRIRRLVEERTHLQWMALSIPKSP